MLGNIHRLVTRDLFVGKAQYICDIDDHEAARLQYCRVAMNHGFQHLLPTRKRLPFLVILPNKVREGTKSQAATAGWLDRENQFLGASVIDPVQDSNGFITFRSAKR